ncbi:Fur family transcriptional regulator [Halanaerobium salsuginis]|jgi:Fe2+ or Zn2+ uptake regulation protein|uniref:Fur family transcriptional regulator, ferric uptake regulator n=1 Tax=Halanaerobium salsuginis TaxID=29563 RepID=A0A1I4LV54_9FIRM|nr:Fur family transcriptional regulator [Halanaerobium salsuginis]SFL94791.1 Fur family transcriptional regulator, ferric uptake regulator [Halanaerobium salsuginis]
MNQSLNLEKKLKKLGIRVTSQRIKILELMAEQQRPLTAADIFARLKTDNPKLRLSTVYRNLNNFVAKNIVSKIELKLDKKESYFELLQGEHHHHLICLNCGQVVPLSCPLEDYESKISKETNYKIVEHRLKLYGLCPKCQ